MQNNKTPILMIAGTVVIFVLVLGFLFSVDQKQQDQENVLASTEPSNGTLSVESSDYDFGVINMYDGDVSHRYQVTNNSDEPVTIGEVYTSCMCTTAQAIYSDGSTSAIAGMRGHSSPTYLNRTIEAGESVDIEAVFDPAAHGPSGVGPIHRSIFVKTNSTTQPQIELTFDSNVVR